MSELTEYDFRREDRRKYQTAVDVAAEIRDGFHTADDVACIRAYAAHCVLQDRQDRDQLMPCGHPVSDWQPDQASCGGCNELADERARITELEAKNAS